MIRIVPEQSKAMRNTQEDDREYNDELDSPTEPMLPVVLAPHTPAPSPAEPVRPDDLNVPTTPAQPRYSYVPGFVGVCFVTVQVLLLVRVILLLFAIGDNALWARVLLTAGGVFAFPIRLLLDRIQVVSQFGPQGIDYLAPLLAILCYGVMARFLVRFLKAFLNSR